jgi:hypothetical protein
MRIHHGRMLPKTHGAESRNILGIGWFPGFFNLEKQ